MAGLLGAGEQTRKRAIGGLETAAQMESQRKQAGEAIETAETQQKGSMAATGAAVGAYAGLKMGAAAGSVGGPVGMAIGAGLGLAGGYILSEIF